MGAFCIFALQNSICEDACDVHSKKYHKLGINSTHAPTSQSFRTCDRTRWRRFFAPPMAQFSGNVGKLSSARGAESPKGTESPMPLGLAILAT